MYARRALFARVNLPIWYLVILYFSRHMNSDLKSFLMNLGSTRFWSSFSALSAKLFPYPTKLFLKHI